MSPQPIAWMVYTIDGTIGYFTALPPTLLDGEGAIALVAAAMPTEFDQIH